VWESADGIASDCADDPVGHACLIVISLTGLIIETLASLENGDGRDPAALKPAILIIARVLADGSRHVIGVCLAVTMAHAALVFFEQGLPDKVGSQDVDIASV